MCSTANEVQSWTPSNARIIVVSIGAWVVFFSLLGRTHCLYHSTFPWHTHQNYTHYCQAADSPPCSDSAIGWLNRSAFLVHIQHVPSFVLGWYKKIFLCRCLGTSPGRACIVYQGWLLATVTQVRFQPEALCWVSSLLSLSPTLLVSLQL